MGIEIDLLKNYPKSKRNTNERAEAKTPEMIEVARQYGKEFFDGDRKYGYGGFNYHPRFWQPVVPDLVEHFGLSAGTKLLDIGCAKGFMLYDLMHMVPGIELAGIDISSYAIEHAQSDVKPFLQVGDAKCLPYPDNSFDVVISINTIHNLDRDECAQALREIERVSRGKSFITVDAYRNEEERQRMMEWALTAKTIMSVEEWKQFFKDAGYSGDYYWFIP